MSHNSDLIYGVGSQRGATCSPKIGHLDLLSSYASYGKRIATYISTLYIFEKVMVLTLERVQADFDLNRLVTVVVHCKNDVFGRM